MADDHYVAVTYLKRWANEETKVWAYHKSDLRVFSATPKSQCHEPDGDKNPDYFAEPNKLGNYRAEFEPNWSSAVADLESGTHSMATKYIVSGYWANLIATTPIHRRMGAELYEKEIQSILPIITKDSPSPHEVSIKAGVDLNYIKAVVTNGLPRGAWQLYNQPWTVLINETDSPFLTSDNPAALFPARLFGGSAVRFLPLSSRLCITTRMYARFSNAEKLTLEDWRRPPSGPIVFKVATHTQSKFINKLTVLNADDFVYSHEKRDWIFNLVKKYSDYGPRLHHDSEHDPGTDKLKNKASIVVERRSKSAA